MASPPTDTQTKPGHVFGYGSLIFRPDLEYTSARWTRVPGWTRRFYQASTDHRGVPGAPGRVVTLLPEAGTDCWGVTYTVPGQAMCAMLERLDRREVGGYERHYVTTYDAAEQPYHDTLLYLASEDNPAYAGPAPVATMAEQILHAVGPSGPNHEYLLKLADALQTQGIHDSHVHTLADAVRALMQQTLPGR